ncbi:MAG TPA: helix-turn-helix domain-containing protein [Burkholderiaceae bacterium]|nr:helix-turn-helix domain-containing protein [Burkholderiaceae bacterium]
MPDTPATTPVAPADLRLHAIGRARDALLSQGAAFTPGIEPWIARSWRRCMAQGRRPTDAVAFDAVGRAALRQHREANATLLAAASPVLADLDRLIAPTRYFSILTDAAGVVVAVGASADSRDRRVHAIARIGVDLSERRVGTTAIGAALGELHPVWLHRGEHFFEATSVYSCAGAPIVGPDGRCAGMLDLTGVLAPERPELRHLAARMARRIEDALLRALPHRTLLQVRWPGIDDNDEAGLLALDQDGRIVGADRTARTMLSLDPSAAELPAVQQCFAAPPAALLDLRSDMPAQTLPLWSGLQVTVAPVAQRDPNPARWRDAEAQLIREALQAAGGNVAQAARRLGLSRATLYRRLASRGR